MNDMAWMQSDDADDDVLENMLLSNEEAMDLQEEIDRIDREAWDRHSDDLLTRDRPARILPTTTFTGLNEEPF